MLRISRWASLVAALLLANVAVAASVAIEHPDVSESFEETSSTGERTNPHLGAAHSSAENQSITAQNASSLPYETSDISVFVPHGGAHKAGDYAQKLCQWLGDNFPEQASLPVNFSFAQYYPEGSNPSLELLYQTYPADLVPPGTNVSKILSTVGPDVDLTQDAGYGRSGGRETSNGPLGGLPAFCRYGASIKTSNLTGVLFEVWLPLASNPDLPLAAVNSSDYPTESTPVVVASNGTIIKGPPSALQQNATTSTTSSASPTATTTSGSTANASSNPLPDSPVTPSNQSVETDFDARGVEVDGNKLLGREGWAGRLLYIGNGGQRGSVPLTDLKQALSRYRFAVAGSNAGHFSDASSATWVNGSQYEETLSDWAFRATHVSQQISREVIDAFYGKTSGVRVPSTEKRSESDDRENQTGRLRAYYAGCSVGGKSGLASVQEYPDDFDGVLAGSPAIYFNRLNAGQIHTQSVQRRAAAKDGWFSVTHWPYIHQVVLKQCDLLDGVKDGVVTDPRVCQPRFEEDLLCGRPGAMFGDDESKCLNRTQIENLYRIYQPTIINGTFVYDAYQPGLEQRVSTLKGTAGKAQSWFELAILKFPQLDKTFDAFVNVTLDDILLGERENPGLSNSEKTDISAFLNAGHKLMHYHGWADITVSPASSVRYYEEVSRNSSRLLNDKTATIEDHYRLFMIPGMSHCRDGEGPWHFGSVTQNDAGNRPLNYDSRFNMILSLIAWAEHGIAPDFQVGAHYNERSVVVPDDSSDGGGDSSSSSASTSKAPTTFESYDFGLNNTRKLCPYPKVARYMGGETSGQDAWRSFECL